MKKTIEVIWRYLSYVVRHKWYVMIECFKVGLVWRGLVHDLSKLLPDEFFPYAWYFYGPDSWKHKRSTHGYYKPYETGDRQFDYAWLKHQKRNKHHWQWWILPKDNGGYVTFNIPLEYRKEMLCDWKGAGKAKGKPDSDIVLWYRENKDKMQLHTTTRIWIEEQLHEKDY